MPLQPSRTVDELRELRELTGDENGAQRVAWTDTWERARTWLAGKLDGLGLDEEIDEAGNQWWTLRGPLRAGRPDRRAHRLGAERRLARRRAERRRRGRGAAADRRGGRAGRDRAARQLGRRGGRALRPLALRVERGRGLDGRPGRAARAEGRERRPPPGRAARPRRRARLGARRAQAARERGRLPRAPHRAGPGARVAGPAARGRARDVRRRAPPDHLDGPGRARRARRRWTSAATRSPARRSSRSSFGEIAARAGEGAVCTSGDVVCKPGIVTSVVETAEQLLDQRHLDAGTLAAMLAEAKEASERFAQRGGLEVAWERIWAIEPILFDADLVELADEAVREVAGTSHRLPSGPAPRRRRGRPRRRPDGDALRPEPARALAHEARGHEAGAPRALACRRSTAWRRRRSSASPRSSPARGAVGPPERDPRQPRFYAPRTARGPSAHFRHTSALGHEGHVPAGRPPGQTLAWPRALPGRNSRRLSRAGESARGGGAGFARRRPRDRAGARRRPLRPRRRPRR